MTDARIGYGTLFKTGNGATPEVFTTMAEVGKITPPSMKRDSHDASHGQSPGGWREFIAGLKDGDSIKFEMNFVPGGTAAAALMAELNLDPDQAVKNRQVVFPDGSMFEVAAFLTNYEPDAPHDSKMSATCTFKVSGAPVLTQAT